AASTAVADYVMSRDPNSAVAWAIKQPPHLMDAAYHIIDTSAPETTVHHLLHNAAPAYKKRYLLENVLEKAKGWDPDYQLNVVATLSPQGVSLTHLSQIGRNYGES